MAKRKGIGNQTRQGAGESTPDAPGDNGAGEAGSSSTPAGQGESIQGYFRRIFKENPKLLKGRSNQALLDRWMADHPGHAEVPRSVKTGLANIKSVLRRTGRKRKPRLEDEGGQEGHGIQEMEPAQMPAESGTNDLETLEAQIDECLMLARNLDREGLQNVISLLRSARNEVVWKLGE